MEKSAAAIKSLRARAEEFRARAADCVIARYSELMCKGATHLEGRTQVLEMHIASQPPVAFDLPADFRGMDR